MKNHAHRPAAWLGAAGLVLAAACSHSSGSKGSPSAASPATTAAPGATTPSVPAPAPSPAPSPGPSPVVAGPSMNGSHATQELSVPVTFPSGHKGSMKVRAPVGPGPWPTVFIVHGWGAFPALYEKYAEHYASRGFVAARFSAPFTLDPPIEHWRKNAIASIDALENANRDPASALFGLVDMNRFAVLGHSYGGAVTLGIAATDSRCKVAVALSPGVMAFYRSQMLAFSPRIACPVLVVGAEFDEVVFVKFFARPAFDALPGTTTKEYVEIAGGEHNNYCDDFECHIQFPTPAGPLPNIPGSLQRTIAADYATAWIEHHLGLVPDPAGYTDGTHAALDEASHLLSRWSR